MTDDDHVEPEGVRMAESPRRQVLDIMYGMVEIIDQELGKWATDPGGYTLSSSDLDVVEDVRAGLRRLKELRDSVQ